MDDFNDLPEELLKRIAKWKDVLGYHQFTTSRMLHLSNLPQSENWRCIFREACAELTKDGLLEFHGPRNDFDIARWSITQKGIEHVNRSHDAA